MKRKDYEPIKFEIFQSDMEKIMYNINEAISRLNEPHNWRESEAVSNQLVKIKNDLQHKIDYHKRRGEWI